MFTNNVFAHYLIKFQISHPQFITTDFFRYHITSLYFLYFLYFKTISLFIFRICLHLHALRLVEWYILERYIIVGDVNKVNKCSGNHRNKKYTLGKYYRRHLVWEFNRVVQMLSILRVWTRKTGWCYLWYGSGILPSESN